MTEILLKVILPFAELAGVRPGEERKPLCPAWKAELERGKYEMEEVRYIECYKDKGPLWQQKLLPFLSSGRCRCLCTAETSPAQPWPEPVWCASPPPPWEPGTPLGNRTPPVGQHQINNLNLTYADQDKPSNGAAARTDGICYRGDRHHVNVAKWRLETTQRFHQQKHAMRW